MSSQPYPSAVPASVAVAAGTTAADALAAAGVPLTGPSGAVVVRDLATDALKDLRLGAGRGRRVEPVALDSGDGRSVLRHSTAHVLAQAVQELFPEAKLGIGPPIKDGFYYDFDVGPPVHPRGPQAAREADAGDRQGRAAVLPPGRSPTTRPAPSWPTSRTSWS